MEKTNQLMYKSDILCNSTVQFLFIFLFGCKRCHGSILYTVGTAQAMHSASENVFPGIQEPVGAMQTPQAPTWTKAARPQMHPPERKGSVPLRLVCQSGLSVFSPSAAAGLGM